MYIYIYMCVCVCVCVFGMNLFRSKKRYIHQKRERENLEVFYLKWKYNMYRGDCIFRISKKEVSNFSLQVNCSQIPYLHRAILNFKIKFANTTTTICIQVSKRKISNFSLQVNCWQILSHISIEQLWILKLNLQILQPLSFF